MPDMLGLFGYTQIGHAMTTINVARVYLRVSTEDQDLQRQEAIIGNARTSGYYVATVYREKGGGTPESQKIPSEKVVSEVSGC
ncbi:hypothetical protein ALP05_200162 [Pseudomonas caricapapayae]|uniref:Resolvase/invertase-type recombinase catalytic domain-containing protein n=1 Tax=Pseudomonas caricapapayae TaxID=46678 RepID=A0A3M6FAI2_9PSED|nr:hypothetical protein ALP05_200162 [Pseudomonas caricapapayae]